MHEQPPERWGGYHRLSKLLAAAQLGDATPEAIGHFVRRCYTDSAYKYKGNIPRWKAFAPAIQANLQEYKPKFRRVGITLLCFATSRIGFAQSSVWYFASVDHRSEDVPVVARDQNTVSTSTPPRLLLPHWFDAVSM
jgi:hypothetical protein